MVQVSKPCSTNHSIAEECARPGTCRSKVGCEAIDEPCTKRIVPRGLPVAGLFQRNSLTSPLRVQCSLPFVMRRLSELYALDSVQESAGLARRSSMNEGIEALDSFPKLLMHHAKVRAEQPAIREKDLGIWQTWTWREFAEEVRALACGLADAGLARGAHFALIGANRPRIYAGIAAAQCLGAIPVPLYQDAAAAEMAFPIQNASVSHAIAEDQEQVDKLLEILPQCPSLKHIYYDDARGLRNYRQPGLLSYDNLLERSRTVAEWEGITDADVVLAFMPPAWIGQNIFSYAQPLVAGYSICCPESAETVTSDMREIGPTYYFAPPRVFEALLTQVSVRMEDASPIKRAMYRYFMRVAQSVGERIMEGKAVGVAERLLYGLGDLLVYGPLRNVLGMSRIRIAYTGGEAIGPDLFVFYRSLGIN